MFFGLPTLYTALTKAPEAKGADLKSLRLAVSAAEILSAEVFNVWKAISGLDIMEGLGSTEVFVARAEELSGAMLDGLFHAWLSAGTKPAKTADNGF